MQVIPFHDIVPGASVRITLIEGRQYLSIRDIIMCLCEKNKDMAGRVWRDVPEDKKNEVRPFLSNFLFPGQGQSVQPVITFPGALKLAMFLPGERAKQSRSKMAEILQRYYAGDESLVAEVRANAVSAEPVPVMARASLASEPVDPALETRKRQLELEDMELNIRAKRARVEAMELANVTTVRNELASIKNDPTIDPVTRYAMELAVKRAFHQDPPAAIEDAPGIITISGVAIDLGFAKPDARTAMAIGTTLAALYRNQYGAAPRTVVRLAYNNVVCPVKIYTDRDRDLVEQAVRQHMQ